MGHNNAGQYSANDLAQYIFWTGDEAGVAKAIEELIEMGMLSREAALILLKEIRIAIDNLDATYSKDEIFTNSNTKEVSSGQRQDCISHDKKITVF